MLLDCGNALEQVVNLLGKPGHVSDRLGDGIEFVVDRSDF